jgi:hypothetical protein
MIHSALFLPVHRSLSAGRQGFLAQPSQMHAHLGWLVSRTLRYTSGRSWFTTSAWLYVQHAGLRRQMKLAGPFYKYNPELEILYSALKVLYHQNRISSARSTGARRLSQSVPVASGLISHIQVRITSLWSTCNVIRRIICYNKFLCYLDVARAKSDLIEKSPNQSSLISEIIWTSLATFKS